MTYLSCEQNPFGIAMAVISQPPCPGWLMVVQKGFHHHSGQLVGESGLDWNESILVRDVGELFTPFCLWGI